MSHVIYQLFDRFSKVIQTEKQIALVIREGSPYRFFIDLLLHHGRLSRNELADKTRYRKTYVSHHLLQLKKLGWVISMRKGKEMYYTLHTLKIKSDFQILADAHLQLELSAVNHRVPVQKIK